MPNAKFPFAIKHTAQNPKQVPEPKSPKRSDKPQTNGKVSAPQASRTLPFSPHKGQKNIYKKLAHAFKLKFAHQAAVLSDRA